MVSRVRGLLEIVNDAERSAARAPGVTAAGRVAAARKKSLLKSDLEDLQDIEDRLARLRIFFPDANVEEGPLVARARSVLSSALGH